VRGSVGAVGPVGRPTKSPACAYLQQDRPAAGRLHICCFCSSTWR